MVKVVLIVLFLYTTLWGDENRTIPLDRLFQSELLIKDKSFKVWLAIDSKQKEEGLSNLTSDEVSYNEGMLFIYPFNEKLSFWMKDTLFDLDIAYLDEKGEIVDIYRMEKGTLKEFVSTKKVRYALEFRAGIFKKLALKVGEKIALSSFIVGLAKP